MELEERLQKQEYILARKKAMLKHLDRTLEEIEREGMEKELRCSVRKHR